MPSLSISKKLAFISTFVAFQHRESVYEQAHMTLSFCQIVKKETQRTKFLANKIFQRIKLSAGYEIFRQFHPPIFVLYDRIFAGTHTNNIL